MSDPVILPPITLTGSTSKTLMLNGITVTVANGVASWTAGLNIDVDGAPEAYNLDSALGLDRLENAQDGRGGWAGVVCGPDGKPVVRPGGWLVAQTALRVPGYADDNPSRYVDATRVPFLSIPPELRDAGIGLGDVCRVDYNGQWSPAIIADIGPHKKVGEGSPALARALGINPSARSGGVAHGVSVRVWLGSSLGWPRSAGAVLLQVQGLFGA